MTVRGATSITGNTAAQLGGGIYNGETATVYHCEGVTISANNPNDTDGTITPGICP